MITFNIYSNRYEIHAKYETWGSIMTKRKSILTKSGWILTKPRSILTKRGSILSKSRSIMSVGTNSICWESIQYPPACFSARALARSRSVAVYLQSLNKKTRFLEVQGTEICVAASWAFYAREHAPMASALGPATKNALSGRKPHPSLSLRTKDFERCNLDDNNVSRHETEDKSMNLGSTGRRQSLWEPRYARIHRDAHANQSSKK